MLFLLLVRAEYIISPLRYSIPCATLIMTFFLVLRKSKAVARRCAANTPALRVTAFSFLFILLTRMVSIAHCPSIEQFSRTNQPDKIPRLSGGTVNIARQFRHYTPALRQYIPAIFRQNGAALTVQQAYRTVFTIFKTCFLDQSVLRGIINPEHLRVSGDGTPIVTSARERRHRVCDCRSKGIFDCKCPRFFSQPDCDIGWDSSRDRFYSGYDMYVLTDSEHDLPLFPLLHPASKHDSHGFCEAFFRFQAFLPELKPK